MTSKNSYSDQARRRFDVRHDPQPGDKIHAPRDPHGRARFSFLLLLLPLFLLSLFGCPLYNPAAFIDHPATPGVQQQTGPNDISSTATQVTLLWDPPAAGASQVVSYTVSYRAHGTSTWNLLATIPATAQPSFTVLRSAVGPGVFDFAVAAVDSGGTSSTLHTSLDPTADPTSGWYLSW